MHSDRQGADPLDGNAAAGLLGELFALDIATARIACAGCGAVAVVAEVRVYGAAMGAIMRCAHCDTVLLRIAHTPAGLCLDMRGTRTLMVTPE